MTVSLYLYVPTNNKVVCITQCAAAISMHSSLEGVSEVLRQRDVYLLKERQSTRVVMWFRDPMERFLTALKFVPDVDEILDLMERAEDSHWDPQTKMHTYSGVFLPDRVYPFDSLEETWAQEFPDYPLKWENKSTHEMPVLNEEQLARVIAYLKEDYKKIGG